MGLTFWSTWYISTDEYIIILYYAHSASEVTTLWRYTNLFIIIIIIIIFLAHRHKACRQLKIKQEMTAVGD